MRWMFCSSKKDTLEAIQNQKSPVKLKKIQRQYKMCKHTTIAPTTADFKYEGQEDVTSIQSLANVAPEQSNLSL